MIQSITVKIGDREIALTLEEAKTLRNELNDLLGDKFPIAIPVQPTPIPFPIVAPTVIIRDYPRPQYPPPDIVWCGTNSPFQGTLT